MQIENKMFQGASGKLLEIHKKRMLRGNEFQRVGADAQKEREPNRRLVRGT